MLKVLPFRGYRINPSLGWEAYSYMSPLREIISEAQSERLRSFPNNSIHVASPLNVNLANQKLSGWLNNKFWIQDQIPSFYPCFQQFAFYSSPGIFIRKGFIAKILLNQKGKKLNIIPHEGVTVASLKSRIDLLLKTKMNITPIHCLYEDSDFFVEEILDESLSNNLKLSAFDEQGVMNFYGLLDHTDRIEQITNFLQNKKLFLADGHHRLEAAQQTAEIVREDGAQYIMAYLSNISGNDLRILPTHRLVKKPDLFNEEHFIERLKEYFILKPFNKRTPMYDDLKPLNSKDNSESIKIGLMLKNQSHILTLKPEYSTFDTIKLNLPDSVKKLDYTILHYLVLDHIMGYPYFEQSKNQNIQYFKDYTSVVKMVQQSDEYIAFIVNEVSINDMIHVCNDGAIMPPKSTYFYPKMNTGYVFRSFES